MALQAVFGFIPRIYGKGRSAKQLCEYMMSMRREMQAAELELSVPPQFDTLIILDRQVRYVTNSEHNILGKTFQLLQACSQYSNDFFVLG